jgi:hypothetical protein
MWTTQNHGWLSGRFDRLGVTRMLRTGVLVDVVVSFGGIATVAFALGASCALVWQFRLLRRDGLKDNEPLRRALFQASLASFESTYNFAST